MTRTAIGFRHCLLIVTIPALALASVPLGSAHALTPSDPPTPPAPSVLGGARLELLWAAQRFAHDRMALLFENTDQRLAQAQALIDRAKLKGKDVAAVQAALDALAEAIKAARPTFESMNGIIASHQGFDANGKVVDLAKAIETVREMGEKLREVRGILMEPAAALRDAIRSFRQANQPIPTPSP